MTLPVFSLSEWEEDEYFFDDDEPFAFLEPEIADRQYDSPQWNGNIGEIIVSSLTFKWKFGVITNVVILIPLGNPPLVGILVGFQVL